MENIRKITVFEQFPKIKQIGVLNIVIIAAFDEYDKDFEAELLGKEFEDIGLITEKHNKYGYVSCKPTSSDSMFRIKFIAPNLDEDGYILNERYETELVTDDGIKYMLFSTFRRQKESKHVN